MDTQKLQQRLEKAAVKKELEAGIWVEIVRMVRPVSQNSPSCE